MLVSVMELMLISKHNSLVRNLLSSMADSFVGGYGIMCLCWIVTGMKYNALVCCKIYLIAYFLLLAVLVTCSVVISVQQKNKVDDINRHLSQFGYDDEYYRLLENYIGEPDTPAKMMIYASCLIEGGRYAQSRRAVEKIDFSSLPAKEQDEYFNICLYSAVMEGNKTLANEIYSKGRLYFERAVTRRRCGGVQHTLGMLCLLNGNYENAEELFLAAFDRKDPAICCECCLSLGQCFIETGKKDDAKQMCYDAAKNTQTYSQACRLKQLMMKVEAAYSC